MVNSSPKQILYLPTVLQEGKGKSLRTAALICKSILEIPGISQMFRYETVQNFKKMPKIKGAEEKLKTCRGSFSILDLSGQNQKDPPKIWCDIPFHSLQVPKHLFKKGTLPLYYSKTGTHFRRVKYFRAILQTYLIFLTWKVHYFFLFCIKLYFIVVLI